MDQIEIFQQTKNSIKEEILNLVKEATPLELKLRDINRRLDELRLEYSKIDREQADAAHLPLELQVLKVNPAKGLYERLGLAVIDETKTHYLMRRPIANRD